MAKINPTKTNCKKKMLPDENGEQISSNCDDICQYMLLVTVTWDVTRQTLWHMTKH